MPDREENLDRYHRQTLLPQIGAAGAARLAAARVLLVGCGALGTTIAEQLVRAGVGFLRIVDRDIVELTNLQRQMLFDEADATEGTPKAIAAGRRLAAINSSVRVEPVVADVNAENIEGFADSVHLILDGTDNAETRYLINDVAVKHGIPWIYGACIGIEGRVMTIVPGQTPCLRCIFSSPPAAGELPTCDTAGVLGPAATIVGAMQAIEAIRVIVGGESAVSPRLVHLDFWRQRFGATALDGARNSDCPCCGQREFSFLAARGTSAGGSTSLCGRNAVQVRPPVGQTRIDLKHLEARLRSSTTDVQRTPHLLKCRPAGEVGVTLTIFPDGRAIVHGTDDPAKARSIYARWVGS
jgi:adenylyltransferase/sulfurtransferase